MRTLEIPEGRWPAFVDLMNRLVAGRPVRLEVVGRRLGDQEMIEKPRPLRAVGFDTKGGGRGTLTISVGLDDGEVSHRIADPTRLYLGEDEGGQIEWLAIEERGDAGVTTTLLYIGHLPELQARFEEWGTPA